MTKDQQEMWNKLKEPEPIINKWGTKFWYNKSGQLHRDNDQPAVIWTDGYKAWWINGKRHRDNDQPAIVYPDGSRTWWVNGQAHRDNDMPSYVDISGTKTWYINGKFIRSESPNE